MSEGEEKFEKTDAGASESYPVECGTIKKGSFMVFEGRPCKVVGYTTAKTGKHGHAKVKSLVLIFSMEKNMKILYQLPILLMYQILKDLHSLLLMLMLMDI